MGPTNITPFKPSSTTTDSTIYKRQVNSFFTASGKKPFTHRLLILSTDKISPHVDTAMQGQNAPVQKISRWLI